MKNRKVHSSVGAGFSIGSIFPKELASSISLNEQYDKEMERIREERFRFASYKKEKSIVASRQAKRNFYDY